MPNHRKGVCAECGAPLEDPECCPACVDKRREP
jgi:rubrerythrin